MQVVHPLVEAGIDKAGVQEIARAHGLLDLTDLPAQPCLSSRIETGIAIDAEDLAFVHRVETEIRKGGRDKHRGPQPDCAVRRRLGTWANRGYQARRNRDCARPRNHIGRW
jgi:PP-loop superfamily ATP-utilizing enzyme